MKKKIISIILSVFMVVGMIPATAVVSLAGNQEPIEYDVCVDGVNQVWETRYCTEYTVINEQNKPTEWTEGWYVCEGCEYAADGGDNRIEILGDVHLIMTDGAIFTVYDGIEVGGTMSLSIYQQASSKKGLAFFCAI